MSPRGTLSRMGWACLTVDVALGDRDCAAEILFAHGAQGAEVRDDDTQAIPPARAPEAGRAVILAYFDRTMTARGALAKLRASLRARRATIAAVATQDWSEGWKRRVRARQIGRLWVGPPWMRPPRGKVAIVIEPKMAFGTGDHPTTALCLAGIQSWLSSRPGSSVLDVGTGTGVLAIAAHKLGAGRVVAIDNDLVAVRIARETAAQNRAPDVVISQTSVARLRGSFDLVVANILAGTHLALASVLARRTRHCLMLSGLLRPQVREVEAAFFLRGFVREKLANQGEWARLDLRAPHK